MDRDGLRDDEWDRIKDFLPGREGHVGGTAPDNRLFVDAVLYRYRTGIPWRDLPVHFGSWKSTHQRFSRWCKSGVFDRVLNHLASDADGEYVMIDATIIRAHQHSAGARKKGRRPGHRTLPGRLTSKIHALADALGNPVRLILTGGHVHDIRAAGQLLEGVACGALLGDKGYDADALIERLRGARIAVVIPPKSNRKDKRECDFILYKERNLIERLFGKLKQFRAIATRYDKLARNFLGAIRLVAAVIQLN